MTRNLGKRTFEADAEALKVTLNLAHPWVRAISAHWALPGVRAVWPMSTVDYVRPECTDVSGHGYDLQSANALGDVTFGYDGVAPIAVFAGGANQYLTRADAGANDWADVLGTEAYITAAQRGLTLGGWFYWAALPGAQQFLIVKDDGGANRQYGLILLAGNTIRWRVWPGPVTVTSAATINAGWNHCMGIYDQPSQTLFVELNGVITAGAAGAAPAALADTGAPLTVGADGAGGNLFTGYGSMCSLCAASVSQVEMLALYTQTRGLYRV